MVALQFGVVEAGVLELKSIIDGVDGVDLVFFLASCSSF